MVNRLNTTVAVGQGTAHMENLVDKDLTNGTTFISGAKVESVTEPSYTIRDVKHTYKAGTTAGFVVTLDNSVLKLTVVDLPMRIFFYKNGKPISNVSCEQKQGSLLSLKLASFNTNTFEFTAVAPADFDEIGLGYSEGLTLKALGGMTVKYAFVGKNGKYYIDSEDTNGIKDFKAAVKRNYPKTEFNNDELVLGQCIGDLQKTPDVTGNTIDNNPDDSDPLVIGAVLAIPTPITVSAYGGNETNNFPFKRGMTIGFETAGADVLDVGKFMQFRPYVMKYDAKKKKYSWTQQTVKNGEFTLLGLDLGGGRKDIITTLDQDCNAVELFAMSGLKLGASVVYRMFVELPPSIDDDDTLRVSAAQAICEDTKEIKLNSNDPVTWACKTDPNIVPIADDNTHKVYTVSGFTKAGPYTFEATSEKTGAKCTTTITYGVQRLYDTATMPWVNNFTQPNVTYNVMTNEDMKRDGINGFSLLDISKRKNADNLVNGSIDDYMSYTGGFQLTGSKVVAAVKRSIPLHLDKPTRVGFVLMMKDQYLSVDLLSSMKIYAYCSGKPCGEITRDHNFKVLGASIAGESGMQTTEFNVELMGDQDIDEIMLCTNGVLNIDVNDIRVYYAYSEAEDDAENFEKEQNNQGEIVSYNDGARIDESMLGGYQTLVAIASLKNNYANFIDGNMTDYLSVTNTVEAASGANIIPVKLGKIYSGKHLVQINMSKVTGLADVDLGDVVKLYAYLQGKEVASKTTWNAVDANVIKAGGDYTLRWTPNADFDEIVIQEFAVAKLLNTEEKFYGMRIYSDADGDGIPDYEDDESCPNEAFLVDENEPSLNKIHDFTNSKMYLHRTFNPGKWSTICLPVDLTYNQFANTFGSEARLAKPVACKDKTPNTIQFDIDYSYGNQVLLQKNTPYIIRVGKTSTIDIPDTIKADNTDDGSLLDEKNSNLNSVKQIWSTMTDKGTNYLIHGVSYDMQDNNRTTIDCNSIDHTPSDAWKATHIKWYGTYVTPQAINESFYSFRQTPRDKSKAAELVYVKGGDRYFRGLRCWMTTDETTSGAGAKELSMAVGNEMISDGIATGINEVNQPLSGNGNIYTLTGVLVRQAATSTDGLSKGIYIWNNKKIEIK